MSYDIRGAIAITEDLIPVESAMPPRAAPRSMKYSPFEKGDSALAGSARGMSNWPEQGLLPMGFAATPSTGDFHGSDS